jgi:hypothetical protein
MEETLEDAPVNALEIVLAKEHDARDIAKRLKERPPRVLLHVYGNSLVVAMEVLAQGEEVTVGKRILEEMASSGAAAQGERGREAAS